MARRRRLLLKHAKDLLSLADGPQVDVCLEGSAEGRQFGLEATTLVISLCCLGQGRDTLGRKIRQSRSILVFGIWNTLSKLVYDNSRKPIE